jgi:hypothetical protein
MMMMMIGTIVTANNHRNIHHQRLYKHRRAAVPVINQCVSVPYQHTDSYTAGSVNAVHVIRVGGAHSQRLGEQPEL